MASTNIPVTTLFIACCLLAGCGKAATRPPVESPPPSPPSPPAFVAGQVVVGFRDAVSEAEADRMFLSHGLSWQSSFSKQFAYWVEVESGDRQAHVEQLSASSIVSWAKVRGNPFGEPGLVYIIVHFNVRATHESAQALIASLPGLRVSSMILPPQWGVAAVEPDSEMDWVARLGREVIVKYADVNRIGTIGGY